jgi:hypothetical protein
LIARSTALELIEYLWLYWHPLVCELSQPSLAGLLRGQLAASPPATLRLAKERQVPAPILPVISNVGSLLGAAHYSNNVPPCAAVCKPKADTK